MIVLDASVLIAYLDAEDAQHQQAESLLEREIDDEFAVNPLTLAEVLVGPSRTGRLDATRSALRASRGRRTAVSCRHRCSAGPAARRHGFADARLLCLAGRARHGRASRRRLR